MLNENSFSMFFNWTILYAFIASSIATAQATVIPTIALFPLSMAYYQLQTFTQSYILEIRQNGNRSGHFYSL